MEEKGIIRNTFSKNEKLCSEKLISRVFADGKSIVKYPLRAVYIIDDLKEGEEPLCQVLVSVPKKRFKRAVKRNRIKRLIREAYRLNKYSLVVANKSKRVSLSFVMLDDKEPTYKQIQSAVVKVIDKILLVL